MPYLIFLWLLFLELVLGWKNLLKKPLRIDAIVITTAAPTYLIGTLIFVLNDEIMELGRRVGVPCQKYAYLNPANPEWLLDLWGLSIEFVVFTTLFVASILLMYRIDGMKRFAISMFFLGATSCFYMIDTFYPFGTLNALQGFVPALTSLVVSILNWMGYKAWMHPERSLGMSVFSIEGLSYPVAIAWGCAGIQSLFIYTFVILLFIKGASISLKRKIIYIAIGAIGTFLVNLLRIVSICVIGVHRGTEALKMFHEYYGELFFIVWIIAYLMVITYGGRILTKLSSLTSKI